MEQVINLAMQVPFIYGTDQCHIVDTSAFPKSYKAGREVINIQSYFNGSIVRYKGRLIFCCRADQPSKPDGTAWFKNIRLIICELDEDFTPKEETIKFLDVSGRSGKFRVEDARLFVSGGYLYCSYGDGYEMYLALLDDKLRVVRHDNITVAGIYTPGNDYREKNWTPFDFEGSPYFVYGDNPRAIYNPNKRKFHLSQQSIGWNYGVIRGGTPAIPYKDELITFFHGVISLREDDWTQGRMYTMGAYTFKPTHPFNVTSITHTPLMRGEYIYPNPINGKMILVVFPSGVIEDVDSFWVSLGINDACTGIVRISKNVLTNMLQGV